MKIDGKLVSTCIANNLNISETPCLGIILVGNRPDSELYVSLKIKKCDELNIKYRAIYLPENISKQELIQQIESFNTSLYVHGILLQLPLPKHLQHDTQSILNHINPKKDVDCLTSYSLGRVYTGTAIYYPCTPRAVMSILDYYEINVTGQLVCVVGSGNVGKTTGILLMERKATVIMTNKETQNLKQLCQQADIIISACGQPLMIKEDWVKKDAFIIDVGISRIPDKTKKSGFRTVGDVDFDNVIQKASVNKLTVGPVTIITLIQQLVESQKFQNVIQKIS